MEFFKKSPNGKMYESQVFNDMFLLQIYPNGYLSNSVGNLHAFCQICSFPPNIREIIAKIEIICVELDVRWLNIAHFTIANNNWGWDKNIFDIQQLYKYDTNNIFSFREPIDGNISTVSNQNRVAFNNKVNERMPQNNKSNNTTISNGKTVTVTTTTTTSKHTYSKQDIFERKLCVLICKLTPDKFDKVLAKMLEFMDNHVQTQNELKIIVDKTLRFTLNAAHISQLTAKLFLHFYDYLPRLIMTQQYQQHLWDTHDIDISLTFRRILIIGLEKLFSEFLDLIDKNISEDTEENLTEKERIKTDFFALMEIIGEIYNIDLIHVRVLRKKK
eukprot:477604_1